MRAKKWQKKNNRGHNRKAIGREVCCSAGYTFFFFFFERALCPAKHTREVSLARLSAHQCPSRKAARHLVIKPGTAGYSLSVFVHQPRVDLPELPWQRHVGLRLQYIEPCGGGRLTSTCCPIETLVVDCLCYHQALMILARTVLTL